jgi:hypothetical protein
LAIVAIGTGGVAVVVTVIETRVAAVTVTAVEPDTPLRVAVIETLPTATPNTSPGLGPPVLSTVAVPSADDVQLTSVVRSSVLPSLKSPVAVSCPVVPLAIVAVGTGGVVVTVIESRVAAMTVTGAEPDTPLRVALIETFPTATPNTSPGLGSPVLSTVAVPSADDVQLTSVVRSWVLPSLKSPVAVSCTAVPLAIEGLGKPVSVAVTIIEVRVAAVTVTAVEPDTPLSSAAIDAFPTLTPVTTPGVSGRLLTCAIAFLPEVQLT